MEVVYAVLQTMKRLVLLDLQAGAVVCEMVAAVMQISQDYWMYSAQAGASSMPPCYTWIERRCRATAQTSGHRARP